MITSIITFDNFQTTKRQNYQTTKLFQTSKLTNSQTFKHES